MWSSLLSYATLVGCILPLFGGRDKTCKNPEVELLMKKLTALDEVLSPSAINNDALKDIQKELEDL